MKVSRVERLDLRLDPAPWVFAQQCRAEIDAHFAAAQRIKPQLWNGRVLLLRDYRVADGMLCGAFFETDYASFHAWIAWGRPAVEAVDCFGAAAVRSSDGVFLLAQMAAHTANAGRVYFPCGTPDPADIRDGKVDFDHSIRRELLEETGLDAVELETDPGWTVVEEAARLVAYRTMRATESGEALRRKVEAHLARQADSELAAVRPVRGAADLVPAMPDYVQVFLRHVWSLSQNC
jgi:8-oxo-dGTP pyrophosphatase MutT (NUDIX family)